jgi:hypothetical protein
MMMAVKMKNNKKYPIRNMTDLVAEKRRLRTGIRMAEVGTDELISQLPLVALRGGVDMIIGAVVKRMQENVASDEASAPERVPVSETLKDVGKETMIFAITQLLERMLKIK